MRSLFAEDMFVLFAILAAGALVGRVSVRGVSLGSAGVLCAALVAGHLGGAIPPEVTELGLVLFVYAVGLQAGPSFFGTLGRQGIRFVAVAVGTVVASAVVTWAVARLLRLPFDLTAGLFTGAMTSTPALAAAVEAVTRAGEGRAADVSVGYGVAYPFSIVVTVLLVGLLPRLLRRDVASEEARYLAEERSRTPPLLERRFVMTNPNCAGLTLADLMRRHVGHVAICRVKRGDEVFAARPDLALEIGDLVQVVGRPEELDKMRIVLGEETDEPIPATASAVTLDVDVTDPRLSGVRLEDLHPWKRFGVVVTRLRRHSVEFTPGGRVTLEPGDHLRLVGDRVSVEAFARLLDPGGRRANETNMVPFLVGLVLGVAAGSIPIPMPNGMSIRFGPAGGAFVASLVIGHFGRVGPLRVYVPQAAKNLSRELGLMLFLAGTGTSAGSRLVSVLATHGWQLPVAGVCVTVVSLAACVLVSHRVFRMNVLATAGVVAASMTNSPALQTANEATSTELPTLAYAAAYPVALVSKIVVAQALVELLR